MKGKGENVDNYCFNLVIVSLRYTIHGHRRRISIVKFDLYESINNPIGGTCFYYNITLLG